MNGNRGGSKHSTTPVFIQNQPGRTALSDLTGQCPASSILSGQRQLDFPMLFERYQQQSGLWEKWESRGLCGISNSGGKRAAQNQAPRVQPSHYFMQLIY